MADKIMTPFDEMINTDSMQMIKAMIPFCPTNGQRALSMYAKAMEFRQTMDLFQQNSNEMSICSNEPMTTDPMDMIQSISKYCNPGTREKIEQMVQMFATIQMFQMMQDNDDNL